MAVVQFDSPTTISPQSPCLPDGARAITPSDTDTFEQPATIYVGGAGIVTCTPANGQADVAITCAAGCIIPFRVIAVKATGTTATLLVGVY